MDEAVPHNPAIVARRDAEFAENVLPGVDTVIHGSDYKLGENRLDLD